MLLNKKAQSTAEYAIVIGLVIAVVAGVVSVAVKGGIREKHSQALDYLKKSGSETLGEATNYSEDIFSAEYRKTEITASSDKSTMAKGGFEKKQSEQTSTTTDTTVETLNRIQ